MSLALLSVNNDARKNIFEQNYIVCILNIVKLINYKVCFCMHNIHYNIILQLLLKLFIIHFLNYINY